jgi:hypothetical protein
MSSVPRCRNCGQPLAIIEDGESHETYCPDCVAFRPTFTFEQWMAATDEVLVRKVGVCSADLPDIAYRDLYDTGYTPTEAADEAITNSMN